MAFVKDKTGSAQTAANASATLVAAYADQFGNFDEAVKAYNELREQLFADLAVIVDADNAAFNARIMDMITVGMTADEITAALKADDNK